ncbi:hypothetical protein [Bradyrhizobium sp. STM 3557]|uniref:hypothetical protein n=1 Tax=Bradyrhizobium sp. STM 3557 TaxID=578920 RepID=UPI00388F91AF
MRDQAAVLQALIIAAEHVLGLRNPGEPEDLLNLALEIEKWSSRAAPDGRVIFAYTEMLADAVGTAATAIRLHNASDFQIYFRIIGVILPDVRVDFGRAIEMRRRPTP